MYLIYNPQTKTYFKRINKDGRIRFGSGCLEVFRTDKLAIDKLVELETIEGWVKQQTLAYDGRFLEVVNFYDHPIEWLYDFAWIKSNPKVSNERYYILNKTHSNIAFSEVDYKRGVNDYKFSIHGFNIDTLERAEEIIETMFKDSTSWVAYEKLYLKIVKSSDLKKEGYRGSHVTFGDRVEDLEGNIIRKLNEDGCNTIPFKKLTDKKLSYVLGKEKERYLKDGVVGTEASYDSEPATREHIRTVNKMIKKVTNQLELRGVFHDESKLKEPEKSTFDKYTPMLRDSTYGSDEYKQFLKEMTEGGLDHHYARNSHHPEFYVNGINGMNIIDLVEMFCDWKAATLRHADGDINKSIDHNKDRFNMSDQLVDIFRNSVHIFDEEEE